jgi:hypothetical protein
VTFISLKMFKDRTEHIIAYWIQERCRPVGVLGLSQDRMAVAYWIQERCRPIRVLSTGVEPG